MDPNWRHIIPPGQNQVISEGHCIEDCTAYAFPMDGIHIFAVMMRTHLIGKEIKLRQVCIAAARAATENALKVYTCIVHMYTHV